MFGKETVIAIDDELNILSALKRLLRQENYEFLTTDDPEEVFEWLGTKKVALIISDHRMPKMEGTKVLQKSKEISPDTIRIMLTGFADLQATMDAVNIGSVWRFLTKPWDDESLKGIIREGVKYYRALEQAKFIERITEKQNEILQTFNINLEKQVEKRTEKIVELNSKIFNSLVESIQLIGAVGDTVTHSLGSHAKRVATLVKGLGSAIGLSKNDLFQTVSGAYLHELGKLSLPRDIQTAALDALTDAQKKVYETYPLESARFIRMISSLNKAADIVAQHEECLDGSGFPKGLKEDQIMFEARILKVANDYDYRLNMAPNALQATPEKILEEMAEENTIFSPVIVSAFKEYLKNSGQLEKHLYEVELSPVLLRTGMILAQDLISKNGTVLITKDTELTDDLVDSLRRHMHMHAIQKSIAVYRRSLKEREGA